MQGFLNINKPSGITSAFVLNKIKYKFKIKKIGHLGTLDPLASGVLPVAIGKATKLFDYFLQKEKEYIGVFKFGFETDTLDIDGKIVKNTKVIPTKNEIISVLPLLTGTINQVPPIFSAKKVNGKKAYELARKNVDFVLQPKKIEIYNFELTKQLSDCEFEFKIACSAGTYIRSLGRDLAEKLNSLCTLTSLTRIKAGKFNIENSVKLDDILTKNSLFYDIINIEDVVDYTKINIDEHSFNKLKNGQEIETDLNNDNYLVLCNEMLLGIAKAQSNNLKLEVNLFEEKGNGYEIWT